MLIAQRAPLRGHTEASRGSIGWTDLRAPGELIPAAGADATSCATVISVTPGFWCGGVRCFTRVRFWLATVCVAVQLMSAHTAETHDNAKKSARAILRMFLLLAKGGPTKGVS